MNTYRVVHVAITLLINKDQFRAIEVRKYLAYAHNVTELIDILPVLYVEVVDASNLTQSYMKL